MTSFFGIFKAKNGGPANHSHSKLNHNHSHNNNNNANHAHNNMADSEIASNLKAQTLVEQRTLRILLLGAGDSGKTTIVKQMKKIHNTLTKTDMHLMTPYIRDAVISYMKILCIQSDLLVNERPDTQPTTLSPSNHALKERVIELEPPYELNAEIANDIALLWQDQGIRNTLALRHKYQIHDNVAYFMDHIASIAEASYLPSFEDYLRIRTRSTGFAQEKFVANLQGFGNYTFEVTDVGGQRSERKKWFHVLNDSIHAILYVVAISEYDLMCFEDDSTNRMHEAISLFKQCVRERYLDGKSVILFFNKYDLFKEKIKTVPITVAFDDFPADANPNSENVVCRFLAGKFLNAFDSSADDDGDDSENDDGSAASAALRAQRERQRRRRARDLKNGKKVTIATALHIHRTRGLDTNNIEKVFKDITLDLVKTNLKKIGF